MLKWSPMTKSVLSQAQLTQKPLLRRRDIFFDKEVDHWPIRHADGCGLATRAGKTRRTHAAASMKSAAPVRVRFSRLADRVWSMGDSTVSVPAPASSVTTSPTLSTT